jgi:aurora kinase
LGGRVDTLVGYRICCFWRLAEFSSTEYASTYPDRFCPGIPSSLGIAYRDLKGENVLVFDDDTVKLADFGWAIQLSDENYHRGTLCGTPDFVPPEMIQGNELCLHNARHVDQWSLWILTWELLEQGEHISSRNIKRRCIAMK